MTPKQQNQEKNYQNKALEIPVAVTLWAVSVDRGSLKRFCFRRIEDVLASLQKVATEVKSVIFATLKLLRGLIFDDNFGLMVWTVN